MNVEEHGAPRAGKCARKNTEQLGALIQVAVHAAICSGYVVGREVRVGRIPGIIIGYNIGRFGRFVGNAFPLLVRTALGVTKCAPAELKLI
jgi:hypothetical protein